MDAQRYQRVETLFHAAQQLPAEARPRFLDEACGGDGEVRREVEALLAVAIERPSFLAVPSQAAHPMGPAADGDAELPLPFQLGPYRLLRELGRGGMGRVYLAEQRTETFRRTVAIKLLPWGGPFAERFRAEQRILAGLEHPHIARLYDGGIASDGCPFLALEFVEGENLVAFCETRRLPLRERLALFRQVCGAVQYAHQHLVVHRDLKPANILVTAAGEPKLLDFGIAKLLQPDASASAPETVLGLRAMTPTYASPEQVRGEAVSTASDVYSLGVILFELLTGERPYRLTTGSVEEVSRAIAEQPLRRPSAAAAARGAAAPFDPRRLRGDLDTIALKALDVEPGRRYPTAAALADDLRRQVEGLPVLARPDSLVYRTRRFVRRNRWAVGASALTIIALVATAAVAVRQAYVAGTRFDQVRGLATELMFDLHDAVAPLEDSLDARRLIVDRSLGYLDALAQDAGGREEVQLEVVRGYLRLSSILGRDLGSAGLGRSGEALARTEQAVAVARRAVAARPRSAAARLALVEALEAATDAYDSRGDSKAAASAGREALTIAEAIVAERPGDASARARLATATRKTGTALFYGGATTEGLDLLRRAVMMERALLQSDPASAERQLGLSAAHHFLGVAAVESGDLSVAEANLREALRLDEQRYAAAPSEAREDVADDLLQLSQTLVLMRRHDEARELLVRVVALRREAAAAQPKSNILALRVGSALNRLALASLQGGNPEAALAPGRESLSIVSRVWESDQENNHAAREYFLALADLSLSLMGTGQTADACAMARRAASFAAPRAARLPTLTRRMQTIEELVAECTGSPTGVVQADSSR